MGTNGWVRVVAMMLGTANRDKERRNSLLAIASAIVLSGCPAENSDSTCTAFCDVAVRCGILPSPLGSGDDRNTQQANCRARCRLSDEVSFTTITRCAVPLPPDASTEALWCGDGTAVCAGLDACLASNFPMADVTAEAAVSVYLIAGTGAAANQPAATCEPSPDPSTFSAAISCSDDQLEIETISVTLVQRLPLLVNALDCAAASAAPILVEGLSAGPVQPSADVEAGVGIARTRLCRRFYGGRVILAGGSVGVTSIAIPTTADEFGAGAPCATQTSSPPRADGGGLD